MATPATRHVSPAPSLGNSSVLHAVLPGAVMGAGLHMARALTTCRSDLTFSASAAPDIDDSAPSTATTDVSSSYADAYQYHPGQFEPQMDTSVLYAQLFILVIMLGMAAYWWLVLVPSERQTLAKAKRKGAVGDYLLQIESQDDRKLERWFYSNWRNTTWFASLQKRSTKSEDDRLTSLTAEDSMGSVGSGSVVGANTFTTPSTSSNIKSGDTHEDAGLDLDDEILLASSSSTGDFDPEYEDKEPAFFSFDNPIILAATMLTIIVMLSAVSH